MLITLWLCRASNKTISVPDNVYVSRSIKSKNYFICSPCNLLNFAFHTRNGENVATEVYCYDYFPITIHMPLNLHRVIFNHSVVNSSIISCGKINSAVDLYMWNPATAIADYSYRSRGDKRSSINKSRIM